MLRVRFCVMQLFIFVFAVCAVCELTSELTVTFCF